MEKTLKFNSQIATSRSQSERLLALGIKPETADMCWQTTTLNGEPITYPSQDVWLNGSIITNNHFPAWSLHRLIEMMPSKVKFPLSGMPEDFRFEIRNGLVRYYNGYVCCVMEGGGYYKAIIDCIEWLIKNEYFNKEYLV